MGVCEWCMHKNICKKMYTYPPKNNDMHTHTLRDTHINSLPHLTVEIPLALINLQRQRIVPVFGPNRQVAHSTSGSSSPAISPLMHVQVHKNAAAHI